MAFRIAAVIWTVIALAINAYVHFSLAPQFDLISGRLDTGQTVSLGQLFRLESIVNAIVALLVLIRPRRWSGLLAALVALVGLALTVGSTVTSIPLPLGLPTVPQGEWMFLRIVSAAAQSVALVGSVMIAGRRRRR